MDVAAIQTRVKNEFGDNSGVHITDSMIINWINDALIDFEREVESRIETLNETTVAETAKVTLSEDPIKINRVVLDLGDEGYRPLKITHDTELDFELSAREGRIGRPTHYIIHNENEIILSPTPDDAYNLLVEIVPYPEEVDDSGDTPTIAAKYHRDLVVYCNWKAAQMDNDPVRASEYANEWMLRLAKARSDQEQESSYTYGAVKDVDYESYGEWGWFG